MFAERIQPSNRQSERKDDDLVRVTAVKRSTHFHEDVRTHEKKIVDKRL